MKNNSIKPDKGVRITAECFHMPGARNSSAGCDVRDMKRTGVQGDSTIEYGGWVL